MWKARRCARECIDWWCSCPFTSTHDQICDNNGVHFLSACSPSFALLLFIDTMSVDQRLPSRSPWKYQKIIWKAIHVHGCACVCSYVHRSDKIGSDQIRSDQKVVSGSHAAQSLDPLENAKIHVQFLSHSSLFAAMLAQSPCACTASETVSRSIS